MIKKAAKGLWEVKVKKIVVKKEEDGYSAHFEKDTETYEWGRTKGEAVGNLIIASPKTSGIRIEVVWVSFDSE